MDSSTPPPSSVDDGEETNHKRFECPVCLDLLYKPIVLACGHVSCFWCVHKAMNGFLASQCPLCRKPYNHFPSICELLHLLLLKIEHVEYKRREKEVLEEEKRIKCFSPLIPSASVYDGTSSGGNHLNVSEESRCACEPQDNGHVTLDEFRSPISVNDVLCVRCKEILFHPAVLNCGHVYCESCISELATRPLRCGVCDSNHPGERPSVCLDLDQFVQEQFPSEYALRKETSHFHKFNLPEGSPSSSNGNLQNDNQHGESSDGGQVSNSTSDGALIKVHFGVGCDSCGSYPIFGNRYKCQDCTEEIGFDLCEACYNTRSQLLGRFNQQHTPDHRLELDESTVQKLFRSSSHSGHVYLVLSPDLHENENNADAADTDG